MRTVCVCVCGARLLWGNEGEYVPGKTNHEVMIYCIVPFTFLKKNKIRLAVLITNTLRAKMFFRRGRGFNSGPGTSMFSL